MSAPEHNNTVEVYLGNSEGWKDAFDYQKAAYLDFKKSRQTHQTHQRYYVDNGIIVNHCVRKTYPDIKQIKKNEAVSAKENLRSGNIIFMMRREESHTSPFLKRGMYYMITDDGRKIPISNDPALKKLHQDEETAKTKLDGELNQKRTEWSLNKYDEHAQAKAKAKTAAAAHSDTKLQPDGIWVSQKSVNMIPDAYTVSGEFAEIDEVGHNNKFGGKRKTKQQRTNKNKRQTRQTRQTRRYFKR